MKTVIFLLLLGIPFLAAGQRPDSAAIVKQVDSLLRQLRPLIEHHKLEEALHILDMAQSKAAETLGPQHISSGTCLAFRGKIFQRQENYPAAEACYLQAMAIQEKVLGRESAQYTISMNSLSGIYMASGDYSKAEPLLLETQAIRAKVVGREHADYARVLNNLGNLYIHKANYGRAELMFLEAIAIYSKTLGKKHGDYIGAIGNLANLYYEKGELDQAEQLFLEVKVFFVSTLGQQHPLYAKLMVNLATLYVRQGDSGQAEQICLELIDLYAKALSKENTDYFRTLVILATIYQDRGDYTGTESMLLEAQAGFAGILGRDHPEYAGTLKNLGVLYAAKADFGQAETAYHQAIEILQKTGNVEQLSYSILLRSLALLYQETNRHAKAATLFLEADQLDRRLIEKSAGYFSETELLAYLPTFQQHTAQFYSFAQYQPPEQVAGPAYDNALFYKGFLLNAVKQVKNRALADSSAASKFEILRSYRHRLTTLYALPLAERDSVRIAELENQARNVEKDLVRTVVGFGDALRQVNWREVQAALRPGEAAVEFIHFQHRNVHGKPGAVTQYAALVLRPGDAGPAFVSLFEERELAALLQGASGANYRKINTLYGAGTSGQKSLYALIWEKLEAPLTGASKVYCSLSGLLHRFNLSAIAVNPRETFADRRQLTVLGSTRQLVIREQTQAPGSAALLVGGVRYAGNEAAIMAVNQQLSRSRGFPDPESPAFIADSLTRGGPWTFLPASATEVFNLRSILQSAGLRVKLDTGYQATEESVKQSGDPQAQPAPRILHFATHGYFFPDPRQASSAAPAREEMAFKSSGNPLLRSGLILAGAQQVWTTGKPPTGREDGVLTAYEISLMGLPSTELVVLSACETGLGDIENDEGVYGLQRAFKIAGAKYIVMSLWKVNDQTTREFMTDFYTQWLQKGLSIPEAFRNAQRTMQTKYPQEAYHWAGFVLVE